MVCYPQGMSIGARHVLAAMAEDGRSSNSKINLSTKDHMIAFDKNIAKWYMHGCFKYFKYKIQEEAFSPFSFWHSVNARPHFTVEDQINEAEMKRLEFQRK